MLKWFSQHADAATTIGVILTVALFMRSSFAEIDSKLSAFDTRLSTLEKDMAVIKTVLIMKNICPQQLASNEEEIK